MSGQLKFSAIIGNDEPEPPTLNHNHHPRWVLLLIPILVLVFANFWLWESDSLIFGLPVNLLYHIGFCVLVAAVILVVDKRAWPPYLDKK